MLRGRHPEIPRIGRGPSPTVELSRHRFWGGRTLELGFVALLDDDAPEFFGIHDLRKTRIILVALGGVPRHGDTGPIIDPEDYAGSRMLLPQEPQTRSDPFAMELLGPIRETNYSFNKRRSVCVLLSGLGPVHARESPAGTDFLQAQEVTRHARRRSFKPRPAQPLPVGAGSQFQQRLSLRVIDPVKRASGHV